MHYVARFTETQSQSFLMHFVPGTWIATVRYDYDGINYPWQPELFTLVFVKKQELLSGLLNKIWYVMYFDCSASLGIGIIPTA